MKYTLIKKAFRCSFWTKEQVRRADAKACYDWESIHAETVFADTAGKARYAYWLGVDACYGPFTSVKVWREPGLDKMQKEPHPIVSELTGEQIKMMKHAWGFESHMPGYRNYYNVDFNPAWDELCALRIATTSGKRYTREYFYHLTELGQSALRSLLPVSRNIISLLEQVAQEGATP